MEHTKGTDWKEPTIDNNVKQAVLPEDRQKRQQLADTILKNGEISFDVKTGRLFTTNKTDY